MVEVVAVVGEIAGTEWATVSEENKTGEGMDRGRGGKNHRTEFEILFFSFGLQTKDRGQAHQTVLASPHRLNTAPKL